MPDERANTIVASGTHNDLRYLEQLVEQIDTLLAQVRVEVVITEVGLSEGDSRGIDSFGFNFSSDGFFDFDLDQAPDANGDGGANWSLVPGSISGIQYGLGFDGTRTSLDLVFDAVQTNSNISLLSAPTIVTTHNKEATVSVGQERPVVTGTTTFAGSSGTGSDGVVGRDIQQQVQYRDIKLELKVKPLIGSDGVVQMEIEQQIQSVVGEIDVNDNPQPIIGTRTANSYVSVQDGDLIALGGLQSLETTDLEGRMAFFGKIPIIGDLFTSEDTSYTKTEILIFIRPTIIRTTADANRDANKLIDQIEGTEDIRGYLDNGTFRDNEPVKEPEEERTIPRRNQP